MLHPEAAAENLVEWSDRIASTRSPLHVPTQTEVEETKPAERASQINWSLTETTSTITRLGEEKAGTAGICNIATSAFCLLHSAITRNVPQGRQHHRISAHFDNIIRSEVF